MCVCVCVCVSETKQKQKDNDQDEDFNTHKTDKAVALTGKQQTQSILSSFVETQILKPRCRICSTRSVNFATPQRAPLV